MMGPSDDKDGIDVQMVEAPDTSQLPSVEEARMNSTRNLVSSSNETSSCSRKRTVLIVVGLVVMLLAVVVGVAVGLGGNDKGDSTPPSTNQKKPEGPPVEEQPPVQEPTTAPPENPPPTFINERVEDIISLLSEEQVSDITTLHTSGSPQNRAVLFLANDDELQLDVPDDATHPDSFSFLQRYAVSVLYYGLGLSNLILKSKPTCEWHHEFHQGAGTTVQVGVTCNNDNNEQVEKLYIPKLSLQGTLPNEIGILKSLSTVIVSMNRNIFGTIPDEMRELTDLRFLDMEGNNMDGQIPTWIGETLTKLGYLSIGDNAFNGTIPTSMGQLTNLTLLNLEGNELSGDVKVIENLSKLKFLYLEHNSFEQTIDDTTFQNLVDLIHLDLSDNSFDGTIPPHFLNLDFLEVLDLTDNLLDGELPADIPDNSALRFLFLSGNGFSGTIPSAIKNIRNLNHLDLTGNQFTGELAQLDAANMVYFFVANNPFTPGPIPEFLRNMTRLIDLSLKGTNRTGPIPTWIGEFQDIVLLDLDRNALTGSIPTEIGSLTRLAYLLLNRNQLEGTLPAELGADLPDLTMLLLDNNSFTGSAASVCNGNNNLWEFSADCFGDAPELECPEYCCTLCCADTGPVCNNEPLLAQFDPMWEQSYQRRSYYDFGGSLNFTND